MTKNSVNFKEIREKIKLTQAQMADVLGVSLRTYQRYEKDNEGLSLKKMYKLSKKLGLSVDTLINQNIKGDGNVATHSGNLNQNELISSPKFSEFVELFNRYGNDVMLDGFIKKLKKIKEISEG